MTQSRQHSALESAANVLIGYLIAIMAQMVILPIFGMYASTSEHFMIAGLFTVVSLVRSYCLRRLFNKLTTGKTYTKL